MKLRSILLCASCVLNVALVAVVLRPSHPRATMDPPSTPQASNAARGAGADPAVATARGPESPAWTKVVTGSLEDAAKEMRSMGVPAAVVKAYLTARVTEEFAARQRAIVGSMPKAPYWKAQTGPALDAETMVALRDLAREKTATLKRLVGGADANDPTTLEMQQRQYGDLPPAKIEQLQAITSDYNDLRGNIYAAAGGLMLPEDFEKLALIEKEEKDDLNQLLTPAEREAYELRSSPVASRLRSELATFNPTETEFKALFKARSALEQQLSAASRLPPPQQATQRKAAEEEMLQQITAELGAQRAAEYRNAISPELQTVGRVVARLGLPPAATSQVVAIQAETLSKMTALNTDRQLSTTERAARLSRLSQDAEAKLANVLGGERGVSVYRQYAGGWLQGLRGANQ